MICGKRTRLRGLERGDSPQLPEWANDPEVTDGLGIYLPLSVVDEEQWFERATRLEAAEKPLAIDMKQGRGWRLTGNPGCFHIAWSNSCAEFVIVIANKPV